MALDPVCNMQVSPGESVRLDFHDLILYFCSEGCRDVYLKTASKEGVSKRRRRYELIVVGGGPAGLTAAVYAAQLRMDAFVISRDIGGQAIDSTKIRNYMGYDFITGTDLVARFQAQLLNSNYVSHLIGDVERVERTAGGFLVRTADGEEFSCLALVVATGMTRRRLSVPGEEEFQRKGVFYGNIQDSSFVVGKDVAVIGGGNSAMQIVESLRTVAKTVHLVSNQPLTADASVVERATSGQNLKLHEGCDVREIRGQAGVEEVILRDLSDGREISLPVSGVFISVGLEPNVVPVAHLVSLTGKGEVEIGPDCSTQVAGLFVAGDVTNAFGKRIVIAAGEGAKAALSARQYVLKLRSQFR